MLPLAILGFAPGLASAAPTRDPVDVQGLELADGHLALPPTTNAWGSVRGVDPRLTHAGLVRMRDDVGPVWVTWDEARQSPSGIIPSRIDAPGTVASASHAEAFASAFIARYLDVLAPGSTAADFAVVANDLSNGIRTVGFAQHHGGRPVHGGQLSVRFVADRLVLVASQALPDVTIAARTAPVVSSADARAQARAFIAREYSDATLSVTDDRTVLVLPVWSGSAWRYHEVVVATVTSRAPLGRWRVYLDAATGTPIAREQQMRSAATVHFDVPVRYPSAGRYDAIAPQLDVIESGQAATTDLGGQITLTNSPTTIDTTVEGTLVQVRNDADEEATASFGASDGETVTWSAPDEEFIDAQLSAFVHASIVKAYVRAIAPDLDWLDLTLEVNVNLEGSCNAISDGNQLYFLRGGDCQNTARLADVVYHEAGHSVHGDAIIPGVGAQQSALSEGISDYLSATMVDDSGMGRGFFYNDDPLRELDPEGSEWTWPQDKGESHAEGRIIGGTLWDLRELLRAKLGDAEGVEHTDMIWYESIRRATDIPTMYPEALVADDDDGILSNGTPNGCEINAAFQAHGLLDPSQLGDLTLDLVDVDDGREVVVATSLPMFDACPFGDGEAELRWRLRDEPLDVTTVAMDVQDGAWVATIPTQATGAVVEYQVSLSYANGVDAVLPRNPADPWYQTFFGAVSPIYCFDTEAETTDWVFAGNGNNWSFGPLAGGGGIDPAEPYDDDGALLTQDGTYPPNAVSSATGPVIDISGHTDVRLQYRRWLSVEDAFFDQATIRVNDQTMWTNLVTKLTNTHHIDREWRFHDLSLNAFLADGTVQVQFGLDTDGGLQLGGWTIDALCVVEVVEAVCGDAQVTGEEQCDDGNTEDGDGCDGSCVSEDPADPTDTTGGDTSGGTTDDPTDTADATSMTTGLTIGDDTFGDGSSSGDAEADASSTDGCGCDARGGRGSWMLAGLLLLGLGVRRRTA